MNCFKLYLSGKIVTGRSVRRGHTVFFELKLLLLIIFLISFDFLVV